MHAAVLISELPFGSEFVIAKNKKGFVEEDLFLRGSRAFLSPRIFHRRDLPRGVFIQETVITD